MGHQLRTELRPERRITLFRDVGARPWILGRRNAPPRGIYDLLKEDDRFSGKRTLAGAHWRLDTLFSSGGLSADLMVFASNPADLYGWAGKDEHSAFAQETSKSGQFAPQWKLCMMAQEGALKKIADTRLRRLLAYYKSFTCTDV